MTLCDPMDCTLQSSSVYGILQARILEWVAVPSSRVSSWPKDWTHISYVFFLCQPLLAGEFFTTSTTWEAQSTLEHYYNRKCWEFPGSPVVRTQHFHCRGPGSILGQGIKILQATHGMAKKERKKENVMQFLYFNMSHFIISQQQVEVPKNKNK